MNVIIPQAPEVHHETIQPPPEYVGDYQEPPHLEGVSHTHHRWSNGRSHGGSSVTTSTLHTPPPVPIIEHKEPVTVTHVHEKPPLTVRVPVTHLHQVTYATPETHIHRVPTTEIIEKEILEEVHEDVQIPTISHRTEEYYEPVTHKENRTEMVPVTKEVDVVVQEKRTRIVEVPEYRTEHRIKHVPKTIRQEVPSYIDREETVYKTNTGLVNVTHY